MSNDSGFAGLLDALDLKPVKLKPMPFGQFLTELFEHPERADTAHALLVRAIEEMGEIDIEKEPLERRAYLRMLRELGYKLYLAFDQVRGSQRKVDELMQHLRSAAANGYQLFLALIIKGPPGCGKSMFVDAFKDVLEGQVVYTVEGCPVHENPLNMLKLLSENSITELAKLLNLTSDKCEAEGKPCLHDMLRVAGEPCEACWSAVMECSKEADPNKALLNLQVTPMRLDRRKFGIATTFTKRGLLSSLQKGNRGLVDMGEIFDGAQATDAELRPLLDATNDRRIPFQAMPTAEREEKPSDAKGAEAKSCNSGPAPATDRSSYQPLDTVLFGQANEGAWKKLIESAGKDAGKFTRRFHVITYPYNTSVTEERMAYQDRVGLMKEVPHFDPMALTLLALLAVISRFEEEGPSKDVDAVLKARICDGEKLQVARTSGSSIGPYGGSTANPTPEYWTVEDLWDAAGANEGLIGLDMTVMFNMLSEIIDRSLSFEGFGKCVSSYEMITFLRERLGDLEKSEGFTDEQRKVIKKCREKFLAPAKPGSKPGAIEAEYQRVLRRQLYEVAAPDFDRRAAELFERYRSHANAYATGVEKVEEVDELPGGRKSTRKVDVDKALLDELDELMGITGYQTRKDFRAALETKIFALVREQRKKPGTESEADPVEINWKTLPALADAIRAKLNKETAKRLEKVLQSPLDSKDDRKEMFEDEDDRRLRQEMYQRFSELGYCKHCLAQAIEYFKLNKLWTLQS